MTTLTSKIATNETYGAYGAPIDDPAKVTMTDVEIVNRLAAIDRSVKLRGKKISGLQTEIVTLTREKHGLIREQRDRLDAMLPKEPAALDMLVKATVSAPDGSGKQSIRFEPMNPQTGRGYEHG